MTHFFKCLAHGPWKVLLQKIRPDHTKGASGSAYIVKLAGKVKRVMAKITVKQGDLGGARRP